MMDAIQTYEGMRENGAKRADWADFLGGLDGEPRRAVVDLMNMDAFVASRRNTRQGTIRSWLLAGALTLSTVGAGHAVHLDMVATAASTLTVMAIGSLGALLSSRS